MKCNHCHNKIEDDSNYCSYCGRRVLGFYTNTKPIEVSRAMLSSMYSSMDSFTKVITIVGVIFQIIFVYYCTIGYSDSSNLAIILGILGLMAPVQYLRHLSQYVVHTSYMSTMATCASLGISFVAAVAIGLISGGSEGIEQFFESLTSLPWRIILCVALLAVDYVLFDVSKRLFAGLDCAFFDKVWLGIFALVGFQLPILLIIVIFIVILFAVLSDKGGASSVTSSLSSSRSSKSGTPQRPEGIPGAGYSPTESYFIVYRGGSRQINTMVRYFPKNMDPSMLRKAVSEEVYKMGADNTIVDYKVHDPAHDSSFNYM